MKKLFITLILLSFVNTCYATDINDVLYGVRNSVETLSDVNRLREQIIQTNPQQHKANERPNIPNQNSENIPTKSTTQTNTEQSLYPTYYPEVDLYGYELANGISVIEPRFNDARPFSEGLAPVYNGYRWGYINKDGGYVIKPKFGGYEVWEKVLVNPFVNGTAAVYMGADNVEGFTSGNIGGREFALIDTKGNVIKEFDDLYPSWYGSEEGNLGEYHAALDGKGYIVDSKGNALRQEY